jgi:diguanylate cyclase (GGDEF)-like protein
MITLDGFGSRACKIRDFCVGGMLLTPLEYAAESPFANPGLVHRGAAVTIDFSVPIGSDSRHFKLHASVARAFEGGMGVAFVNPDGAALRVLESFARMATLSEPLKGATGGETAAVLCQDVLTGRLRPLIRSFFEKIKDRLMLAAREASNNLDQSAHFDAITELERLGDLIERTFSETLLNGFHRMGRGQCPEEQKLEDAFPAELSLLDKNDLEDLLAIGEIIAKAEPRYQGLLTEIEERFSTSVQVPVDKANNPVGPAAVCHAFRGAVRESDIQPKVLQLIYRVFDECVVSELGVVYEELNAVLAAKGVPPTAMSRKVRLEPPSAGSRPGGARTSAVPSPPRSDARRSALPTLDASEVAASTDGLHLPPEGFLGRDDSSFELADPGAGAAGTVPATQLPHGGGLATYPRTEPSGSWTSPPGASVSGVVRRNPGYGTARTLLQLARGLTYQNPDGIVHSSALGESTMPLACSPAADGDSGERAGALRYIESGTHPAAQQTSHSSLRDGLLASLKARRNNDAEQVHIPEQRLDDIDFLDQILRTIADDPLVCKDAKAWIQRLAIPLGQTTIRDEEFLSSQSHPANQVINQLAQIKPALFEENGNNGNEVVAEVTRLIEQIEGDQALDVRMFAAVQARLAAILARQNDRYAANVAQVVRAREEQQAFVKARQKTGKEVGSIARTNTRQFSDEWLAWLTQAKRLDVGDAVMLDAGSRNPRLGTLVWVGEGHNPCVFVDELGKKLATLSLQELAMQLRRGTLSIAAASQGPVVDRAVYTNLRKIHERIEYHATHDPLTGLLNPKEFQRYLGQVIESAGDEDQHHALCWVRLHMADVIHEEAHLAREALLRGAADVLRQALSTDAVLARTGDDEFGVLVENCDEREGCRIAAELHQLMQPYQFTWCGQELVAAGQVGLVPLVDGNHTVASLLKAARSDCLSVTDKDEDCGQFHTAKSAQPLCQANGGHQIVDIDKALAENRLRLTCQRIEPVNDADSERPHYQVVVCLEDIDGNLFPVNDNGGTAFHRKQRPLLDRQIIAQVFRWLATHKSALRGLGSVAISLSAQSLSDESFTDYLMEQFTESKVPPGKVCFEIAEKAMVASLNSASTLIRTIKEFGCRFALDDFGRADASYNFMKELPFNYIKIDGVFVKDIMESSSDFAVVKSINEIGHFMGKKTVAKNVQNEEVLQRVREIGVDYAQGYWIENRKHSDDSILRMWKEAIESPALTN